jgi:DNA-binding transcriptional regulator YiaG
MSSVNIGVVFFFATIALVGLLLTIEVFYSRKNRMVKSISSLVGEHLVSFRSSPQVGGHMPVSMLSAAMNQNIHPDNDDEAASAIETMTGIVVEAKRRSFQLPLVHKDVAQIVMKWAERGTAKSSQGAANLLAHIVEKHAQHMDQLIAQSYVIISESDPVLASNQMRLLYHQLDGALAAGLGVDPSLVLVTQNVKSVNMWLESDHPKAKTAAELLLKTVQEAKESMIE